jgi:hypothetical protein
LVAQKAGRVHGLVVPNDESSKALGNDPAKTGDVVKKPAGKSPEPAAAGQKP